MKALVGTFNQEKALVGAFSVIMNLRVDLRFKLWCSSQIKVGMLGRMPRCVGSGETVQGAAAEEQPVVDIILQSIENWASLHCPLSYQVCRHTSQIFVLSGTLQECIPPVYADLQAMFDDVWQYCAC